MKGRRSSCCPRLFVLFLMVVSMTIGCRHVQDPGSAPLTRVAIAMPVSSDKKISAYPPTATVRGAARDFAKTIDALADEVGERLEVGKRLKVAVRPARMKVGNFYVSCSPLSGSLKDDLESTLLNERDRGGLEFDVVESRPDRTADVEVNAHWDYRDGTKRDDGAMNIVVEATSGDRLVGKRSVYVDAVSLDPPERGCLMQVENAIDNVTVSEGNKAVVLDAPSSSSGKKLGEYRARETYQILAKLVPLDSNTHNEWHLVEWKDKQPGFVTAAAARSSKRSDPIIMRGR